VSGFSLKPLLLSMVDLSVDRGPKASMMWMVGINISRDVYSIKQFPDGDVSPCKIRWLDPVEILRYE
jgi:hypothetical protein